MFGVGCDVGMSRRNFIPNPHIKYQMATRYVWILLKEQIKIDTKFCLFCWNLNGTFSFEDLLWSVYESNISFEHIQFSKEWMQFATFIFAIFVTISSVFKTWMQKIARKIKANVQNVAIGIISFFCDSQFSHRGYRRGRTIIFEIISLVRK